MTPALSTSEVFTDPLGNILTFPTNLPYDDGMPMESDWQFMQIGLLIDLLETNWKGRPFFCGGNMFVHYSAKQVRNREFLGPDFFVSLNCEHDRKRKYWAAWDEGGRYPDFIIELLSETTALEDRTNKKDIYEQIFRTSEYVCYDPEEQQIEGWRLQTRYCSVPLDNDRMWCASLELWLGTWQGVWKGRKDTWIRFFDKDGSMLPTEAEMEANRADQETARARTETARARNESARAQSAELEIERLKKELDALRNPNNL